MIKVVLFDIDNTILSFDAQEESSLKKSFKHFSLGEISSSMIEEYDLINNKYWEKYERGEIKKDKVLIERFKEFFSNHNITCNPVEFNKYYEDHLADTIVFNDDAFELLKYLKAKVKIYAVTNGSVDVQTKKLNKSKLVKVFDEVFISDVMKVQKPNVRFFNYLYKRIEKVEKNEILIVGDSLSSDMLLGINAGIKTCWYNPKNKNNSLHLKLDYQITSLMQVIDIVNE